jgi:hypothetical protein
MNENSGEQVVDSMSVSFAGNTVLGSEIGIAAVQVQRLEMLIHSLLAFFPFGVDLSLDGFQMLLKQGQLVANINQFKVWYVEFNVGHRNGCQPMI